MAVLGNRDWRAISSIADGLDVTFAVLVMEGDNAPPVYLHVSHASWTLTGYWPNELEGYGPSRLYCERTNPDEAARFLEDLKQSGEAEAGVLMARKHGEAFGCRMLGCRSLRDSKPGRQVFFVFMNECPIRDCP